jgi:hypothetical protein
MSTDGFASAAPVMSYDQVESLFACVFCAYITWPGGPTWKREAVRLGLRGDFCPVVVHVVGRRVAFLVRILGGVSIERWVPCRRWRDVRRFRSLRSGDEALEFVEPVLDEDDPELSGCV